MKYVLLTVLMAVNVSLMAQPLELVINPQNGKIIGIAEQYGRDIVIVSPKGKMTIIPDALPHLLPVLHLRSITPMLQPTLPLNPKENKMETMKWVKVNKYCDLSGDTSEAVRARRRNRKWTEGVQWVKREGSIWINPTEVEKWVESQVPLRRQLA
jgi:hypothetical protein